MAVTANILPQEYLDELDAILTHESYSARYAVQGAEFVNANTVNVPDITFASGTSKYDRFATETGATLSYTAYTLDHDQQAVFHIDAVQDIDAQNVLSTNIAAEFERTKFIPEVDTDFFKTVAGNAGGTDSTKLSAANIKDTLRLARTQFTKAGLSGGDLYMTSDALKFLEDATNRQWSNETSITDTVGIWDGFNIFEVPNDVLGTGINFIGISGGTNTARYITKRAVAYHFAPGDHTQGDDYLDQYRWVYGTIVRKNKKPGVYVSKVASA